MKKADAIKLIIVTPLFMLLANDTAILVQEYAHSIAAWLLGYKDNMLSLNYGGTSLLNLALLYNVNENVDYDLITSAGKMHDLALISIAGLGIASFGLYLLSLYLLRLPFIQRTKTLFYFIFWLNFMNLAQIYAYIPVRAFAEHGDTANLAQGLNVSPWLICMTLGYLVAFVIWNFFTRTLPFAYDVLNIHSRHFQAALLLVCTIPLFGYFGITGFFNNGEISHFISAASLFLMPCVILLCWPEKVVVIEQTPALAAEVVPNTMLQIEEEILTTTAIDEDHFLDNLNAALHERDVKIRESKKAILHKLSGNH